MLKTPLALLVSGAIVAGCSTSAQSVQPAGQVMPRYDGAGALVLPDDYRRWILVGSSLGLSYSPTPDTHEMFNHVLMEPTAYRSFVDTGSFRDGTMFVLILQGVGENPLPARRGQFAADVHGVEMAVKDSRRTPDTWAYYGFGGMTGVQKSARAMSRSSCFTCHQEHAALDNVFLQFYPLLTEARAGKH